MCTRLGEEIERKREAHTKYPPDIQAALSLACKALPIMERLAARVVWSIRAMRSTVEQARNIWQPR
jgi:hypothetical protein